MSLAKRRPTSIRTRAVTDHDGKFGQIYTNTTVALTAEKPGTLNMHGHSIKSRLSAQNNVFHITNFYTIKGFGYSNGLVG